MLGYKDPGSIAAEIRMSRAVHDGAFLVVEGVSDMRFWGARKYDTCELVNGEGKVNVVGAMHRLHAENIRGVLGVVDDDYDSLLGVDAGTKNVVTTEVHDLECLLCRSSALEAVLAEFGKESKIRRFEERTGGDVRTGLLERAMVFGRLRWAVARHKLRIKSGALRIPHVVDIDTWMVDSEKLMRSVVNGEALCQHRVLIQRIAALPVADPWRIVRGHDMVQILRIGLRRILGSIRNSTGTEDITRVLRAALSLEEFELTKLCMDMRCWELAEAYPVLQRRSGTVAVAEGGVEFS